MTPDPFTPVPVRARRDGWTPSRQAAFIAALHDSGSVAAACRHVGMSWQTAYRLRARPGAASFATAWDAALAGPDLSRPVSGRAMGGVATPIRYRGRQVGERRRYDDRLARYILSIRRPERYGVARRHAAPDRADSAAALHAALATLEADLTAAAAWHGGDDSRVNVARTSSPFAAHPTAPHQQRPGPPQPSPGMPGCSPPGAGRRSSAPQTGQSHAHRRRPAL